MSYIVIDPISGELSSSNSSGSCNHSVEQLPHYYWSDQEEWGGVELIGSSSSPESWQQLDDGYENRIYVQYLKEEVLNGDHLEQVMSPNMWMAATEPLVQSVQDAVQQQCDEPYSAPVQSADTPLSPTYELHLQDYQLQEQILADEYVEQQEEQTKSEPSDLEPLSGSWLDTISCVDQLDSSFTINQVTQPINTPIHYSNESQSSPTDSYENNYKFEISSVDSDNYVIAGYNDNSEITTVDSYEADNLSNDETAEMVTLQLMDELKALQKQLTDGDSCSTSLDPADINELISQMFGESVVADADQLTTVDSESLWSSGYGDSSSEPALFSPEGSTLSVVFEEDVTTQITKIIDRKYSKEVKFGLERLEENSVDDDGDDDISEDDYSDDSLSDEEFVPSSYSRLTGTKRKLRRAARTTGKRKRREEYALLTPTEKRERKREQNKNAATKYREKKRYEELEREDACDELEKKNEELRREVMEKEREVKVLRRLVINIFRQPGNEALASSAAATALMSGGSGSLKKKRTVKKRERVEMF